MLRRIFLLHKRQIIFGVVVVFIASFGFGCGYLADREFNHTPIFIEQCGDSQ